MIVRIVEIHAADFVGPGEEEDAFVADAASSVLGQFHDVRAVTAEAAVEGEQAQVRAVAVVASARVGDPKLAARVKDLFQSAMEQNS